MIRSSITNGIHLTVAVLILCVLGIIAALRIPIQMIPDLEVRTISVLTRWPGATPQDVEQEILTRQEDYLRSLSGLTRMVSSASTGEAVIELEFPFGVEHNDALIRVNNALSQVPSYPENVDEPRLLTSSFSQNAFMYYSLEAQPDRSVELDVVHLTDYIEKHVQPRMERVPGVSKVGVEGGAERQIRLLVDPNRLAATGLTFTDIRNAIRERNQNTSAGDINSGKRRYLLRTVGRFENLEQLRDLILIREGDDATVRVKDVADVELEHFELRSLNYSGSKPMISLSVHRETGSNVIDIKASMDPVIKDINRDLLEPIGLRLILYSDDVRYVKSSIANVWSNLAIGAGLATLVMFLFLRNIPATILGISGIPICALAAFIGLFAAGRTINVISLAGVAFAIGMTLDNTIVVLEAIERRRRQGLDYFSAALQGVSGVRSAILASTLTTVLVFAPILFIEEEVGQLFSDIAIAISASIIASMLIAITVIPSASVRISTIGQTKTSGHGGVFIRYALAFKSFISTIVAALVTKTSRAGLAVATTLLAALAIIIFLAPPAEYLPEGEEAKLLSVLIAPAGYNLIEMKSIGEKINRDLAAHLDASPQAFLEGKTDIPPLSFVVSFISAEKAFWVAETVNPHHINQFRAAVRERFKEYPGMHSFSSRGSIISSNDGGTRSVNLDIGGNDLKTLFQVASVAYQRAEDVFDDPEIASAPASLVLAQPLIELRPDWERVAELGLSARELGYSIAALTDGAYVDEYLLDGDRVDIFLFSSLGGEQQLGDLTDLPLYAPQQGIVPVNAVVDLVESVDTDTIRRLNGRRTVTLNIIPPGDVPLEVAVQTVKQEIVEHLRSTAQIPQGMALDISGASNQLDKARSSLLSNFVVALLLCYFLLVAIFAHWGYPFIIMATIPVGIAGGIVGLWLLNTIGGALPMLGLSEIRQPFDMITMLGFLILLGTVVNNPILIVDYTLKAVRDNCETPQEAIKKAVASRLRPMMMSTVTTVSGIAPLVLIPGEGTELYRGIGSIVLFGLLLSTFVTLTFMPSLLALVYKVKQKGAVLNCFSEK